jgi:hypothetical protein
MLMAVMGRLSDVGGSEVQFFNADENDYAIFDNCHRDIAICCNR